MCERPVELLASVMHHRILIIANKEASYEDAMADSAQDELIDARNLDVMSRQSGCHGDDFCRACLDLT
jgi:hypothetical protein